MRSIPRVAGVRFNTAVELLIDAAEGEPKKRPYKKQEKLDEQERHNRRPT